MLRKFISILVVAATLLLCGCELGTIDKLYHVPKRSEDDNKLQAAISGAMSEMEYCAPISGENQQIVQSVDLTGNGVKECLVFAKDSGSLPLHILVFALKQGAYVHIDTVDLAGSAFDKVEYAQIDGMGGAEIIVGTQVSEQLSGAVFMYSFSDGEARQLVNTDYRYWRTVDLDRNGMSELFVLTSGPTESDRGVVALYSVRSGIVERSVEVAMSEPAENLKRVLVGKLQNGVPAVFVAGAIGDSALITDIYAISDGVFTNVTLSSESGSSVQTMRNHFVYADDIDGDGIIELPKLMPMRAIDMTNPEQTEDLLNWYAITLNGENVHKLYTYHNFLGGWYFEVHDALAENISVIDLGTVCDFYIWQGNQPVKAFSIYTLTGQSREAQSTQGSRFVLHKTETVIYSAQLYEGGAQGNITQQDLLSCFHLVKQQWNTGET